MMRSWTDGSTTVEAEKIGRYGPMGPEIITITGETVRVAPDFLGDGTIPPVGNYVVQQGIVGVDWPFLQDVASFEAQYSPVKAVPLPEGGSGIGDGILGGIGGGDGGNGGDHQTTQSTP